MRYWNERSNGFWKSKGAIVARGWLWECFSRKKRILIIVALLLLALGLVTYLAYTFWAAQAKDRPTLMYFGSDF